MSESLRSVGLDVGTTSTQMILSELTVENRASSFAVPELEITRREILYRSQVHFTPLLDARHVDAAALERLVAAEYASAGIRPEQVDTGAVIITGETARKDNARAVLDALAGYAGDFVVATAGPDLESVLAAKGAGAVEYSARTGETVLHMDIGGGTSNLAWIEDGKILATGCLDVGGRLLKLTPQGEVTYVSPALAGLTRLKVGDRADRSDVEEVARKLTEVLEMAAGLRQRTELPDRLTTPGSSKLWPTAPEGAVISFSGGVADCIREDKPWLEYGDIGPVLGQQIRNSRLCRGQYVLGSETIRATVIGAGCHSAQLSGSTVFCRDVALPLRNLPVARLTRREQALPPQELAELIRHRLGESRPVVLALPGEASPHYPQVARLADAIARGFGEGPVLVCLEEDMAKALGQALALRLPAGRGCLCIDRVRLEEGSCLDVGEPVGPALPVVVKTLILNG